MAIFMRRLASLLFLGLFVNGLGLMQAEAASSLSATDGLMVLLKPINTLQATFKQTVYDNHQKAVEQSTGKMAIERPGKFRWDVKQPIPQLIIANATRLWIYDPDLEQVTIRSLEKAAGQTPAILLSNSNEALDTHFTIQTVTKPSQPKGWQWFLLKPRQQDALFEMMQLGFYQGILTEMQLTDNLGHMTTIQYQNIKTNGKLPSTLFVFNPPANTDIIDETRQKPNKKS